MARLPYARLDTPEVRPLVERIVAERGSVLHLYQMLMHSPPLAEGWLTFLTAVRHKLDLPGSLRELVIMRVAILNGAPYEADQHAPIALKEGISQAQLDALPDWASAAHAADLYSAEQRAVLALCDSVTRDIHVPADVMAAVVAALGQRQAVEMTATIAAYNMVSRFLEAIQIHSTDVRD